MQIRIIKPLPAPLMDGFDVRDLHVEHVYNVGSRTGNYLIVAGYALRIEADDKEATEKPERR
jgi:hypothetical protein